MYACISETPRVQWSLQQALYNSMPVEDLSHLKGSHKPHVRRQSVRVHCHSHHRHHNFHHLLLGRCVLLLGYKQQMEEMMREANPGLARRFQLQSAWTFEDYSSEDLLHIMRAAAKHNYDWDLPYDALRAGIKVLDQERRRPNFGNAGAVNNLLALVGGLPPRLFEGLPVRTTYGNYFACFIASDGAWLLICLPVCLSSR